MNKSNVIYSKLPDGSIFCHTNGLLYKNYDEFENAFFNVDKDILIKKLESLEKENNNLQSKIDKAIEFINSKHNWYGDEEEDNEDYLFELEDFEQLLSILKEDK